MKNRKVVFIDYDGTLYNNRLGTISKANIDIMKTIKEEDNIDLYLSTGRTFVFLKTQSALLKIIKGMVSANGQYIVIDNKCIYQGFFTNDVLSELLKYCLNNELSISFYSIDTIYILFFDDEFKIKFQSNNKNMNIVNVTKANIEDSTFVSNLQIHQACLFCNNDILDEMSKVFSTLSILKWGDNGADVVPISSSKGLGIRKVIEHEHYDINNTYGIGDGMNDIQMFKNVKTAIVMGNANDEIKKYASFIADHVDNDGLAKVLQLINSQKL